MGRDAGSWASEVRDVADLRQRLIDCWSDLSQNIVDGTIYEWHKTLQARVDETGSHFEHFLW